MRSGLALIGERLFTDGARTSPSLADFGAREPDWVSMAEFLVHGHVLFAPRTVLKGVRELAPERPVGRGDWRADLEAAVDRALDGEAAISLSGGVDSALMAALAVQKLGARNVTAFTYCFDDPDHPSEAEAAARTAAALGIRHHVERIGFEEYVACVPDTFRFNEDSAVLSRARVVALSRRAARAGVRKLITGHGVEQTLGVLTDRRPLEDLARALEWAPRSFLRSWGSVFREGGSRWHHLRPLFEALHAGLRPPPLAAYHMVLTVLRHNGLVDDVAPFYPKALRPLLVPSAESPEARAVVAERAGRPLAEQLLALDYHRLIMPRMFRGRRRCTRLAGCEHVSPAMDLHPLHCERWFAVPEPGRDALLELARDLLPEEILRRRKRHPMEALPSETWWRRMNEHFRPEIEEGMKELFGVWPGWTPEAGAVFRRDLAPYYNTGDMGAFGLFNPEALGLWWSLRK